MMKPALMRTAIGKEDPELTLLQRVSSFKLPASEFAAQIKTDTSQHQQFRGQKPLLKDINNKKRLAWAKKHKQILDQS